MIVTLVGIGVGITLSCICIYKTYDQHQLIEFNWQQCQAGLRDIKEALQNVEAHLDQMKARYVLKGDVEDMLRSKYHSFSQQYGERLLTLYNDINALKERIVVLEKPKKSTELSKSKKEIKNGNGT